MPSPRTQLYAWYSFALSADVYASVGMLTIMPLLLEHLARQTGYWAPDLMIPCSEDLERATVCKAKIFGFWIDTTVFTMYGKSAAMFSQIIFLTPLGPLADDPYWRKTLLVGCLYLSALIFILFFFFPTSSNTSIALLGLLLYVLSWNLFQFANTCFKAYLPVISRTLALQEGNVDGCERLAPTDRPTLYSAVVPTERDPLLDPSQIASQEVEEGTGQDRSSQKVAMIMGRISSHEQAVFLVGLGVVEFSTQNLVRQGLSLTIMEGFLGVWVLFTGLPLFFGLPSGPRSKLDLKTGPRKMFKLTNALRQMTVVRNMLIAWWISCDAMHSLQMVLLMMAISRLKMSADHLILLDITCVPIGLVLTSLVPSLQRSFRISNSRITAFSLMFCSLLPIWGSLGLVNPSWGLDSEPKVWIGAFAMSGSLVWYSYARAAFGEMVPTGYESSFYSLYNLADRSASFLGPLLAGLLIQYTGHFEWAFLLLVGLCLATVPFLLNVDAAEGMAQAQEYAKMQERDWEESD